MLKYFNAEVYSKWNQGNLIAVTLKIFSLVNFRFLEKMGPAVDWGPNQLNSMMSPI